MTQDWDDWSPTSPDADGEEAGHTPGEGRSEPAKGVLVADNLVAGYVPGVPILNGCTLVLGEGELIGVVGPNGAGKSTLVKAIFGLVSITSGRLDFNGEDITSLAAHQLVSKGIGYVPQTNNVFPSLTVEENLEMGL